MPLPSDVVVVVAVSETKPVSTPLGQLVSFRPYCAQGYLDSLTREASGDPTLQRELAAAYGKVVLSVIAARRALLTSEHYDRFHPLAAG